jgi:hypothetical protein
LIITNGDFSMIQVATFFGAMAVFAIFVYTGLGPVV